MKKLKPWHLGLWMLNRDIADYKERIAENEARVRILRTYLDDIWHGRIPDSSEISGPMKSRLRALVGKIRKARWVGTTKGLELINDIINAHLQNNKAYELHIKVLEERKRKLLKYQLMERKYFSVFKPL